MGSLSLSLLDPSLARFVSLELGPCPWMATPPYNRDGYRNYGHTTLHRAVWLALSGTISPTQILGTIPAGLVLDHVERLGCQSRACCTPWHLEPVTVTENNRRGHGFGGINYRKDECVNGHEFDLLNTHWLPNGSRQCRACNLQAVLRYKKRQRARQDTAAA